MRGIFLILAALLETLVNLFVQFVPVHANVVREVMRNFSTGHHENIQVMITTLLDRAVGVELDPVFVDAI